MMCSAQMPLCAALAGSSTHMHARMVRSCQVGKLQQYIEIMAMQPSTAEEHDMSVMLITNFHQQA